MINRLIKEGRRMKDNQDGVINPSQDQLTFAKSLASPDKSIRDKTVVALKKFLHGNNNNDMNELEMLKLWKALYYCYWLSDKVPIQQELALVLTTMFHNIKKANIVHLYIRSFFKTILREWGFIDQHRINKFYTLLRFMIRELFNYMKSNKWSSKVCDGIFSILNEDILNKVPNGPRYQVVDVYLEELMHVTNGDIDTTTFLKCLEPFTKAIGSIIDNIYLSRVIKGVFFRYINDYAVNIHDKTKKDDGIFYNVSSMAIQKIIFDVASDNDTLTKNREPLYQLHQEFPVITGKDFIDDDAISNLTATSNQKKVVDANASDSGSKAIKKSITSSNTSNKSIKHAEDIVKKGDNISSSGSGSSSNNKNSNSGSSSSSSSSKRKVEENPNDDNKNKKSKVSVTSPGGESGDNDAPFIESKKFAGRKPGYCFKKGPKGLGYYTDPVQIKQTKKQPVAVAVATKSTEKKKVHWGGGDDQPTAKSGGSSPNSLVSTPTSTPKKKASTHKATPAKRK